MNCSKANLRLRVLFRNVIIHKSGGELIDYLVATLCISYQSTLVRSLVLVYHHDGSTTVDTPHHLIYVAVARDAVPTFVSASLSDCLLTPILPINASFFAVGLWITQN
jgi:hypothetical protein